MRPYPEGNVFTNVEVREEGVVLGSPAEASKVWSDEAVVVLQDGEKAVGFATCDDHAFAVQESAGGAEE